jgi:hypothetical protein
LEEKAGAALLETPQGCDVFKSPQGCSKSHPVGKDESTHPVGKDETGAPTKKKQIPRCARNDKLRSEEKNPRGTMYNPARLNSQSKRGIT